MRILPFLLAAATLAAPLAARTPIRAGETVTGTLAEGDARMEGSYCGPYVIGGRPGQGADPVRSVWRQRVRAG